MKTTNPTAEIDSNHHRIIIEHDPGITEQEAVEHVLSVIQLGKLSEAGGVKHYCWMTAFRDGFTVAVRRKKPGQTSDSFLVMKEKKS